MLPDQESPQSQGREEIHREKQSRLNMKHEESSILTPISPFSGIEVPGVVQRDPYANRWSHAGPGSSDTRVIREAGMKNEKAFHARSRASRC